MTKTELKNRISEFMKKRYGDEIENSTDLSTVVPEDKVDSCINALMKEMKMNASATQVTIDKGTTIDTMATQMMDEMKAMDKEETMKEDVAEEEVVAAEDETVEEAAKKKKKKDDDDDEEEKDDDDDDDDKKDDDDDEELDEMYHAKKKKKKEEMQEQIESLFSQDETLSEEFKEKAALLFETVLTQRINEEVNELKEELEEQYNANLKEAVEAHAEQLHEELDNLTSKVDEYVTYVAEEWLKENELAVEKGVRTEITENFIFGLKNLFTENYIDVPEEKEDLVVSLEEKTEELQEQVNTHLKRNMRLKKQLQEEKRKNIISEKSEDLTMAEKDQLMNLTESVDFEDEQEFEKKVQIIKEHYFSSKEEVNNETKNDDIIENEQFESSTLVEDYHAEPAAPSAMDVYTQAISKYV
tara:strand:+ start:27700 stop:28941 length:1242 start_codon:yes stop_codon:yes gene_type:complete